jgi:nitrite reductase (NADH) large subunit
VAERTGASTLCGSCRPLLAQLTGGDAPASRVARGLLGISLAAVAAVAILVLAAPIRYGDSWQEASAIEALWRSGEYRRLTGFGTAALAAFASLLTLRKRWRRLSAGPYPAWRLGHALLGVATLVMVCLHTGLRAGDNLSLALMACFAAANVLGAGAGAITAVEHRLGRPGQQYRAGLALLHTVAAWPLPVLIAFHALSAYYF